MMHAGGFGVGVMIDACVGDSLRHFSNILEGDTMVDQDYLIDNVSVYSWPQTWTSTACGFGGVAGRAMTTAQTVIVINPVDASAVVYHNGKYAYYLGHINNAFWEAIQRQFLPGKVDKHTHLSGTN